MQEQGASDVHTGGSWVDAGARSCMRSHACHEVNLLVLSTSCRGGELGDPARASCPVCAPWSESSFPAQHDVAPHFFLSTEEFLTMIL